MPTYDAGPERDRWTTGELTVRLRHERRSALVACRDDANARSVEALEETEEALAGHGERIADRRGAQRISDEPPDRPRAGRDRRRLGRFGRATDLFGARVGSVVSRRRGCRLLRRRGGGRLRRRRRDLRVRRSGGRLVSTDSRRLSNRWRRHHLSRGVGRLLIPGRCRLRTPGRRRLLAGPRTRDHHRLRGLLGGRRPLRLGRHRTCCQK